jgi:hypothetical protein
VTGVTFDVKKAEGTQYILELYDASGEPQIFNQEKIKSIEVGNGKLSGPEEPAKKLSFRSKIVKNQSEIDVICDIQGSVTSATLSVLLRSADSSGNSADNPDNDTDNTSDNDDSPASNADSPDNNSVNPVNNILPETTILIDRKKLPLEVVKQEGAWAWYKTDIETGKHIIKIGSGVQDKNDKWSGNVSVWLHTTQKINGSSLSLTLTENVKERPMPPHPYPANELKRNIKLGEVSIKLPE